MPKIIDEWTDPDFPDDHYGLDDEGYLWIQREDLFGNKHWTVTCGDNENTVGKRLIEVLSREEKRNDVKHMLSDNELRYLLNVSQHANMLVWVHSNIGTGKPIELSIIEVSGRASVAWLNEIDCNDVDANIMPFMDAGIELDTAQWFNVEMTWDDGVPYVGEVTPAGSEGNNENKAKQSVGDVSWRPVTSAEPPAGERVRLSWPSLGAIDIGARGDWYSWWKYDIVQPYHLVPPSLWQPLGEEEAPDNTVTWSRHDDPTTWSVSGFHSLADNPLISGDEIMRQFHGTP